MQMTSLVNFQEEDAAKLISWIKNEEELMQFAGPQFQLPLTAKQITDSLKDKNRFAFKVVEVEIAKTIGYAELYLKENSFMLARILVDDVGLRGKGYGKVIVKQLLDFGFSNFDKTIAELNVFDWNVHAIRCYEKVGFKTDPHIRLERKVGDKIWVAIRMKLHKDDYRLLE